MGGSGNATDPVIQSVSRRIKILPSALDEIEEAATWYEARQPALGAKFTRDVRVAINALPRNALIHRIRQRDLQVRWCYPRRFPYRIVYRLTEEVITIVAVLHASRSERHWRQRL